MFLWGSLVAWNSNGYTIRTMETLGPIPTGHYLLVVVDYFSHYIKVEIIKKTDSSGNIKPFASFFFFWFGLTISVTADNSSQFVSEEFRDYCEVNNIKLINTTPYWPQQNGTIKPFYSEKNFN